MIKAKDTLFLCDQEEQVLRQCLTQINTELQFRNPNQTLVLAQRQADQLVNFALKQHWSAGNRETIFKVLHETLIKSDGPADQPTDQMRIRLLRLLPASILSKMLKEWTLGKLSDSLVENLPLLGLILQATNEHNLSLLFYFQREDIKQAIKTKVMAHLTTNILKALVRCLHAQPMLAMPQVWDLSQLFNDRSLQTDDKESRLLLEHLRRLIRPDSYSANDQENQHHIKERVTLVQSLLVNQADELCLRVKYEAATQTEDISQDETDCAIVNTQYLHEHATNIVNYMEQEPFGHVCICGPPGSGKMSALTLTSHLYTKRHGVKAGIIVVTLEASFDSKNLVGTYVCSESGDFVFKKGPLTVAAEQGLWLVLRNIEECPSDLLSFLLPLIQENKLQVTSSMQIKPKLGFRLCFLQKTSIDDNAYHQHEDIKPLTDLLYKIQLTQLSDRDDFKLILERKHPNLFLQVGQTQMSINTLLQACILFLSEQLRAMRPHLLDFRNPTVTQILQLYSRVDKHFLDFHLEPLTISQSQRRLIIEECADVYIAYMYDSGLRLRLVAELVQNINLQFDSSDDATAVSEYVTKLGREYSIQNEVSCFFGRITLARKVQETKPKASNFVYTSATVRLLEQITTAIAQQETCLLVGETGTGKTTAVQEIANLSGKHLHVFNLNQNTDSADLLGGFKPVDFKYLLKPIYENFRELFTSLLPDSDNNRKVMDTAQKCFEKGAVQAFCQVMERGLQSISKKKDTQYQALIRKFQGQVQDLKMRSRKMESQGGFIFQFVEGTLIKSMQNGDWVLLDEINLASETILNKLATIIQGNHVLLNERADVIEMKIHPEFRVFMCMNPPYSSAGKKQLPNSLRCKLQEVYVPEIDNESDLWHIIDSYTKSSHQSTLNEQNKRTILTFYTEVKNQISKETKRGNIGLRNLCRALKFMNSAIQMSIPVVKAIYDSLFSCFASHLEAQLQQKVKALIFQLFKIKTLPTIPAMSFNQNQFAQIEGSLVKLGEFQPKDFDENEFIVTANFSLLVQQLASVISVSDYAIILEGPTSAGKTSCINYLAKKTHNHVTRINNHMHTDVQEYLGSYIPDSKTGKLGFQEGCLVEAVRKGYWVILDELNLAPSEVLEALNRLLDDNRELHIVETQKVIKAHPNFRIFATQNPTEGYGGRKELSEAFKNRFVMIKVGDVPTDQLQQILEKKCEIPTTRSSPMVKVMAQLQIYRSKESIFSGKNSTITVRDLLKWAGRINLRSQEADHVQMHRIALEGFLVLAERSRDLTDKLYIKETIEKIFKTKLDIEQFYAEFFNSQLSKMFTDLPKELNLPPIIMSHQFKRLACLVFKCLENKEPVLLVGETGCGKTTLCQVFAHAVHQQELFAINCHQNTETSDFIGCMRTRKNLSQIQDQLLELVEQIESGLDDKQKFKGLSLKKRATEVYKLTKNEQLNSLLQDLSCVFEWTDGILVNSMQQGGLLLIDEISLANDSVLERLNSVFERDRVLVISEKSAEQAVTIVAHENFNMVATMNPGNDFGKKELSPALRNRMTEIWVDSYFTQPDLVSRYPSSDPSDKIHLNTPLSVDLNLIISSLCEKQFKHSSSEIATGIFNLICFVNFTLPERYFSMRRKALSIRDILNMIDFILINIKDNINLTEKLTTPCAFRNAAELVIIDGLCLGIDVTNDNEKQSIMTDCQGYLEKLVAAVFGSLDSPMQQDNAFINTVKQIGVSPYVMPRSVSVPSQFAFNAETTKRNLKKLLRAFSLGKPVLIEGLPGVGKTSLIENLAKQTQKKLIRVNLSDQTDMMDLLGSEYPVASSEDDQEIQFSWCDGVLLQAIKEGHWFLIDEMNLAQQSILEGLNAILDHRRQVYIPELNQSFTCHPDFFVFACQNPSSSAGQTSGRKTLPKSFMNRFTKIYLEELTAADYQLILEFQASDSFSEQEVQKLLAITQEISKRQIIGCDQQTVNMRDLARFLKIYRHLTQGKAQNQLEKDKAIATALNTCYQEWQIGVTHGLIQSPSTLLQMPQACLIRAHPQAVHMQMLHTTQLHAQDRLQHSEVDYFSFEHYQDLKGAHSTALHQLVDCLQADLPVLMVTNDQYRLSKSIKVLAQLAGANLERILLNERSDTTQLLGCFEQTSSDFRLVMQEILKDQRKEMIAHIQKLQHDISQAQDDKQSIQLLETFLEAYPSYFQHLAPKLQQAKQQSSKSRFEWVDSVLVQAVQAGSWVVLENANLCNPSVLDRLNGLFEEGSSSLSINEQGLVHGKLREAKKHQNFRSIFVITEATLLDMGKDVSKALRNRCQQISVHYSATQEINDERYFQIHQKVCAESSVVLAEIQHLQHKHDLLPTTLVKEDVSQIKLGKRKSQQEEEGVALSLGQIERPDIASFIQQSYKYYLPLLDNTECQPFEAFITAQIEDSQRLLQQKLEQNQGLDRQLHQFIAQLCTAQFLSQMHLNQKPILHYILEQTLLLKSMRDLFQVPYLVYLTSKLIAPSQSQQLISQDYRFLTEPVDLSLLKNLQKPSHLMIDSLQTHLQKMPQSQPDVYLYKLAKSFLLSTCEKLPRYACLLKQLQHQEATLIWLNDEREPITSSTKIITELEQSCFDQQIVMQTPQLLIVPCSVERQTCILSQSLLYKHLCYVKDVLKLKSTAKTNSTNFRLTSVAALAGFTHDDHKLETCLKQLCLNVLEKTYYAEEHESSGRHGFSVELIKAVMKDEQQIALKDLPACYATSTSLMYKLARLAKVNQKDECEQSVAFEKLFNEVTSNHAEVDQDLESFFNDQPALGNQAQQEKRVRSQRVISKAYSLLSKLQTTEVIKAMFILPLEQRRASQNIQLCQEEIESERFFWRYQLRDSKQPEMLLSAKRTTLDAMQKELRELEELVPETDKYAQYYSESNLRSSLRFIEMLAQLLQRLRANILTSFKDEQLLSQLSMTVYKQIDTFQFASVSHILVELLVCIAAIVSNQKVLNELENYKKAKNVQTLCENSFEKREFVFDLYRTGQELPQRAQEVNMMWLLKQMRLSNNPSKILQSQIMEHFVQREVVKRMIEESNSREKAKLPFQMREQKLDHPVLGKAMDEWTDKDKARMEKEAEKEIEVNFPSYFDDVHKAYYGGEFHQDRQQETEAPEVPMEDILAELIELNPVDHSGAYKTSYLQDRLEVLQSLLEEQKAQNFDWVDDIQAFMSHKLHSQKLKQIMNITDVELSKTYSFYHTPLPSESKLIYQPLVQLQMRLRDVTVRDGYESPLINDALFLSNYMLSCFNVEATPIMKILTCLEFLLSKLDEWENTYASKRLNSVQTEIDALKMLVIRYRKIQILSWRNLLQWRQDRLIRDDFENSVRLAHTVTNQVFSGNEPVLKILDLCDLYIRDSTLGTYKPRITFLELLINHLEVKRSQCVKISTRMLTRLNESINCLRFVYSYYKQFFPKLQQTIARLDADARDKVKLLIDIKKWTLQKFTIMKDNIDKTHRQLNRACQKEEEVLIQNVQSLVLEASRRKFGGHNDQLLSLDPENEKKLQAVGYTKFAGDGKNIKMLTFLESDKIMPFWPSCNNIQEAVDVFMTRMADVRALNKKNPQKRAFYDLMTYMKDEGLRQNYQTELQPMILECESMTTYFYKAYETYVMLKSVVQSEENTDLKSSDVMRCQGFSQHLMHEILSHTITLQSFKQLCAQLDFLPEPKPVEDSPIYLNQDCLKKLNQLSAQNKRFFTSLKQQLATQHSLQAPQTTRHASLKALLHQLPSAWPLQIFTCADFAQLQSQLTEVQKALAESLACQENEWSNREQNMLESALAQVQAYLQGIAELGVNEESGVDAPQVKKRLETLEKRIKLFYQDVLKHVDKVNHQTTSLNEGPLMTNTSDQQSQKEVAQQPILTLVEKQQHCKDLVGILDEHLPQIVKSGKRLLLMTGVQDRVNLNELVPGLLLLQKVKHFISHLLQVQTADLDQMSKFAYLTQRVFLYLIAQGFCGEEDDEESDVEPPSDLERDGMGMGEGKGEDNVADQIENEEQLEGLKNYESDQEQKPDDHQEKQDKEDKEEEDNDFEMKEDFDGEMDDEQKSDDSQKQESDDDDADDQVDDLLDNDLWNKNQEDLEEKEEKEEKEKREQDLGERELQDENIQDKESNEAAGDHDKQEKPEKKEEEKKQPEDEQQEQDQEMNEDDVSSDQEQEGERMSDSEEEQELGLNNQDSVPAEPDEEMPSEDEKSVNPDDEKDDAAQDEKEEEQENPDELDSQFDEKDQAEISDDDPNASEAEDVQKNQNQAVLEDDQIQANEDNKHNDQANLKKQKEQQRVEQQQNQNQNQDKKQQEQQSQQVDAQGSDLLFNFAQNLQQREQKKKQEQQDREQAKPDAEKKQVEAPQMTEQPDQQQQPEQQQDDDMADEYAFDEQAQKVQGKLATDKMKEEEENAHQDQEMEEQEEQMPHDEQADQQNPEDDVQMTEQEAQNAKQNLNKQAQQDDKDSEFKEDSSDHSMQDQEDQEDLIQQYNDYLNLKSNLESQQLQQQEDKQEVSGQVYLNQANNEQFNYRLQKEALRQMFLAWQQSPEEYAKATTLLQKFKNQTQQVTSTLCEQLRIVLEPQLSQNLQGDFKTGKRLNMKKVISFIASNYRNDRIWLRRTLPTKRDYKILIAIDDSLSMKENNLGFFSLEASVALQEALQRLEVGKVAVARIRDRLELVQSFEDNYTQERAAHIVSQFQFKHHGAQTADTSMANFVSDANKLLDMQNQTAEMSCPFVIVLSDGRFNKENVRRFMREAKEKRYLYIFVVLDQNAASQKKDAGIMSMKSAVKQASGGIKLEPYLQDFPFDYYCVVKDTQQLPQALGTILVQWFSIMVNNN